MNIWSSLARLAVAALAVPEKHVATSVDDMPFLADAEDRAAFLAHALEYLMYQPNTAGVAPAPRPAPSPGEAALRGIAPLGRLVGRRRPLPPRRRRRSLSLLMPFLELARAIFLQLRSHQRLKHKASAAFLRFADLRVGPMLSLALSVPRGEA